jgi:GTPase
VTETSQACFEIAHVFEITGRGVVLAGQIRSGVVRTGMEIRLALNSGLVITSMVKSVEFVDHPGGLADVGLMLDADTPALRSLWTRAGNTGDVICVFEVGDK